MKTPFSEAAITSVLFLSFHVTAATLYVDLNSTNPVSPYADWSTAATNIQDAIDASTNGDLILVTNGVYQTGGRAVYTGDWHGDLTNRAAIDKAVVVQSVNGPAVTIIQGNSPLGTSAVRCAYLTNGAALIGFTLTNGATFTTFMNSLNATEKIQLASGAGVWCEDSSAIVSNCVIAGNLADDGFGGMGGGAYSGTLENCTISGNVAVNGGGAYGTTLVDCLLSNNQATSSTLLTGGSLVQTYGGGADNSRLTNCVVRDNASDFYGGGAASSTLYHCTADHNRALAGGAVYLCNAFESRLWGNWVSGSGGGSFLGTLTQCVLTNNVAVSGGAACQGTLSECVLSGNLALASGGGASSSRLNACAIVNNSAVTNGGGAFGGVLNNCTVAGNSSSSGGGTYVST